MSRLRVKTASGSEYEVEGRRVRRVVRSAASEAERVTSEWGEADSIELRLGRPLVIVWGGGIDEFSRTPPEFAGANTRLTVTTRVVDIAVMGVA